jgi:hypothetical protein
MGIRIKMATLVFLAAAAPAESFRPISTFSVSDDLLPLNKRPVASSYRKPFLHLENEKQKPQDHPRVLGAATSEPV